MQHASSLHAASSPYCGGVAAEETEASCFGFLKVYSWFDAAIGGGCLGLHVLFHTMRASHCSLLSDRAIQSLQVEKETRVSTAVQH